MTPKLAKFINKAKSIIFADPKLAFEQERDLINQSFYFQGNNGKGVLLIHGWTSTAYEVRRLGKYLNEEGFTVSGPMLRGHGTKPEDLENVIYQDWLTDLCKAYDDLEKECDQIYIGGTSIGASLGILLALERPQTKGLVLMATPYKIKLERLLEFWGKLILPFKKYNKKFYPPTFGVSTTITRVIAYQRYSTKSALEIIKMVKAVRERFAEIKQPCFLIQSKQDHVVSHGSMDRIYEKLGSEIKKKKYIHRAYHTFISDIKNEHVFEEISNFLKEN
ncbi:MAG TPA: alpha/beta fold hydrolase [Candidatus Moranbacteria bacterium]|nr:alpha/beta fold hydrolase [Candidatus Moranbacteria bacterium]